MKKRSILISFIIFISIALASCSIIPHSTSSQTDTNTSNKESAQTNTGTQATTSNAETNTSTQEKLYTKVDNAIQPVITYKTEKKSYYEKAICYYGQYEYIGKDLPKDFGDYYKVVKTYDAFSELVKSNYLERSVFEDNYILVIHRKDGGKYTTDMGFSNFRIENGEATIDLYEYTGNLCYPDCEFNYTGYYLIPNTIECEATTFAPLNINSTNINSYYTQDVEIEGLELGERALIFDGVEKFKKFKDQYGVEGGYNLDDSAYIIVIEAPFSDIASIGPLTLDGSKLTLTIDDSGLYDYFYEKKYLVIEVPTRAYGVDHDFFEGQIPNDITFEIIINENNQPDIEEIENAQNNRPKTPYDEFLEALLYNHRNNNLTTRVDKVILLENGQIKYGSQISKENNDIHYTHRSTNTIGENGEISTLDWAYLLNWQENGKEYACEIENGVWIRKEGRYTCYSSIYDHFNIPNLQNHFNELTYDEESGLYYADVIDDYDTIYDLRLKIENGYVSYVSFRTDGSYEGASEEYVVITTYDVENTQIPEVLVGSEASLKSIEASDEILAELERIMNERE